MSVSDRPYVYLCSTVSADGKLATFERQQIDLATTDYKDFRALNRGFADAVMIGGNTFLKEDPSLTVRNDFRERFRIDNYKPVDPIKIAVVTRLASMGASDFLDKGNARKIIFTTTQTSREIIDSFSGRADVIIAGTQRVDLPRALAILKTEYGVKKLMVEGGGTLNFSLLEQGLIDEVRVKIGNLLLGGKDAPSLFEGKGFNSTNSPAAKLMRIEKHDQYSHVLVYRVVSREEADKPTGLVAKTKLPTRFGEFDFLAFQDDHELKENAVLSKGELKGARRVPLRIQSECLTGDTFGSYRCDCREQLELSMNMISDFGIGLIVYLRQEGRGNGLINKVRIYEIMDQGHDTVRATRDLEIPVDARSYEFVADVLRALEIKSVSLMTNSPDKTRMLTSLGIEVEGTIPVVIPPNEINEEYLKSKKNLFQHAL